MKPFLGLVLLLSTSLAGAQPVVVSPGPEKVAVTVYRDPNGSGPMQLNWLNGFALISETRIVDLPAGESELRFEGVAGGLVPQSAVVAGLGDSVREKNRDFKLLSPGTLLEGSIGQRVHLRRTSRATGAVVEQDAIIRAATNGVVIETAAGIETLRCDGESETLRPVQVPPDLSPRPTLSVKVTAPQHYRGPVTLTYLSSNFDWRAHYVATLAPDGRTVSLFAWLTLANGDETGFVAADTMAVAGRLNREYAERLRPETRSISLSCWPSQRTHEIPSDEVEIQMRSPPPPPPPPAPPAAMMESADSIVVTGSRIMAQRENLGDLKLYRIPIPVTVASNSQKQVAMIEQPQAKMEQLAVWRQSFNASAEEGSPAQQLIVLQNRERDGLGLPLPSGSFTLYSMRNGQPFLLGEGSMTDRAVGEKVEVWVDNPSSVRVVQREVSEDKQGRKTFEIVATNDSPVPQAFEARLDGDGKVDRTSGRMVRRDGYWLWAAVIPANASRTVRFRYSDD